MKSDRYRDFAELAEHEREGVDYQIRSHRRTSGVAVIAPHGGKIEPGTAEIAEAIAAEHFSFYAFEGLKRGHNQDLHLASTRFDEPECEALLAGARVVLSVHGLSDNSAEYVCIGGMHEDLKERLQASLEASGFDARADGDPAHFGTSPQNLCNRRGPGAQLEISRALREKLKDGTTELDQFTEAVRAVLDSYAKPLTPPAA